MGFSVGKKGQRKKIGTLEQRIKDGAKILMKADAFVDIADGHRANGVSDGAGRA